MDTVNGRSFTKGTKFVVDLIDQTMQIVPNLSFFHFAHFSNFCNGV